MKTTLVAALLVLSAPLTAQAQAYVGAGIGESRLDGRSDTAAKMFGGYQFNPAFAIEAGYHDLGAARSASVTALEASFLGSWELGNRFALLGRVGVYRAETSGFGTNLGPVLGLGASYELTRNASFRLEWQRFDNLGPQTLPKFDIDILSIAALYRF